MFPSSFRTMDDKLLDEITALEGAERIKFILDKCFAFDVDIKKVQDFALVEIEENLCVLELANAKAFVSFDEKVIKYVVAAVVVSAYIDMACGKLNLFLPYDETFTSLIDGAVLAKSLLPIEIFVGASGNKFCGEGVTLKEIDEDEVGLIIRDFSDFDDYVFDPVSALAAGAYDLVEDEDTPSVIVSVASPMTRAREVLQALGFRAKDEKSAREKLEELFAIEPIEE